MQQSNIKKHLPNQFFSYQQNIFLIHILYIIHILYNTKELNPNLSTYHIKPYIQKYLYIFPFFFSPNPQNTSRTRSHEKLVSSFLNTFRVTVLKISDVCSATSKKRKNVRAQGWPGAITL